jgi:hypothetical protein
MLFVARVMPALQDVCVAKVCRASLSAQLVTLAFITGMRDSLQGHLQHKHFNGLVFSSKMLMAMLMMNLMSNC